MEWQNSKHALCAKPPPPRCVCFSLDKRAAKSSRPFFMRPFQSFYFYQTKV